MQANPSICKMEIDSDTLPNEYYFLEANFKIPSELEGQKNMVLDLSVAHDPINQTNEIKIFTTKLASQATLKSHLELYFSNLQSLKKNVVYYPCHLKQTNTLRTLKDNWKVILYKWLKNNSYKGISGFIPTEFEFQTKHLLIHFDHQGLKLPVPYSIILEPLNATNSALDPASNFYIA